MIYPQFIPAAAAARIVPKGTALVASVRGVIVHAVREAQAPVTVCGRRSSHWREATGRHLAGSRLCESCARVLRLDPATATTTAKELADVHAAALRRAMWIPDDARRLEVRIGIRSAAIHDGSLIGLSAGREAGVWSSEALSMLPTPAEAYGPQRPRRERGRPEIISGMDRVRGRYGPAYRSAR